MELLSRFDPLLASLLRGSERFRSFGWRREKFTPLSSLRGWILASLDHGLLLLEDS